MRLKLVQRRQRFKKSWKHKNARWNVRMRLKSRFHSIFFYFNHIVSSVPWFCLSVLVIAYRFCVVCLLVRCWLCCTVLDSLQTRSPQTVLIKVIIIRRSADEASGSVSPLQKDADRAVVVAVTSRAVFESGSYDGDDVYKAGVAFPLLQVKINNCCFCVCRETITHLRLPTCNWSDIHLCQMNGKILSFNFLPSLLVNQSHVQTQSEKIDISCSLP